MTTTLNVDRLTGLEAKLDRLASQVDYLTERAREDARRREATSELVSDLSPIAGQAMSMVTEQLATSDIDTGRLLQLLVRFAETAETLEAALTQLEAAHQLVDDVMPLTGEALATVTDALAHLEARGYFGFLREGAGVLDRIVTTYGEDDIRALGDNIVLILDTIRQMTQPEIMGMLSRTVHSMEEDDVDSTSFFQLARQMRDPAVKRGLARLLGMLRTMGTQQPTKTP